MGRSSAAGARRHRWCEVAVALLLLSAVVSVREVETAASTAPTPTCRVDLADVVAWWRGEDDLTADVGPDLSGTVSYADAVAGRGFAVSGPDVVSASGVTAVADAVTVSAWVRVADTDQAHALLSRWRFAGGEDTDRAYALLVVDDSLVWLTDEQTLRRPLELRVPAPMLFDGQFHHVAATWDHVEAAVYVDGQRIGSAPSQRGTLNAAGDLRVRVGSADDAPFFLDGVIDEPTVFDRALTPAEIDALFTAGASGLCTESVTDTTPPSIVITSPADGGTYDVGDSLTAAYECSDPSGVQSCAAALPNGAPLDTSTPGTHAFTVQAVDDAGNPATRTVTYTVRLRYAFTGFLAPVQNDVVNRANPGRTIPVVWRITLPDGTAVSDPESFVSLTSGSTTCDDEDPIEEIAAYSGNSGLQYHGDGTWQFNWQTVKSYAGQCRVMRLTLADGSMRSARFAFF